MRINIASSSGFCFGVKRAIDMALDISGADAPVRILGDIVHNEFVVKRLRESGIEKISELQPVSEKTILIIRAHGAPKKTFEEAGKCGYTIIDATCPMVQDIVKMGRELEKDNTIIIIGDPGHDEVIGIAGQLRTKPLIMDSAETAVDTDLSNIRKAAVITQSTQSRDNIDSVMKELEKRLDRVTLHDTTCSTTVTRQEELRTLTRNNDVILIVGSPTSANTRRLYEIASGINANTYRIGSSADMRPEWFSEAESTGIMAGASTPENIVSEITVKLMEIGRKNA
ncbi:MAG: 4-hydroxy-3-methylbut-2-enyl diphosphate reductase [Candidatus Omnitrophica bacterium]|nr:4-hydroxy-3-methylbut-2-enyl diphosphate reductase [Candidatus Omnitrophota bacterium]